MPITGSMKTISIDGTVFTVAVDSDPSRDLGGDSNEIQMNGDASTRTKKTPKPWAIESVAVAVDDAEKSQERLQEIANKVSDVAIVATEISGKKYNGTGTITGAIKRSTQNGTCDITLSGPGVLTQG